MIHLVWVTYIALQLLVVLLGGVAIMLIVFFISDKLERYLDNWKTKRRDKQWEKKYEEMLRRHRKEDLERQCENRLRELHRIEKRKYPLFYWRENI